MVHHRKENLKLPIPTEIIKNKNEKITSTTYQSKENMKKLRIHWTRVYSKTNFMKESFEISLQC